MSDVQLDAGRPGGWSIRAKVEAGTSETLLFLVSPDEDLSLEGTARRVRRYLEEGGSLQELWERLGGEPDRSFSGGLAGNELLAESSVPDESPTEATSGSGGGIVAPSFEYSDPIGYHHRVPAAAFQQPNDNVVSEYVWLDDFLYSRGGAGGELVAPVYLPDGAVVTALRCYYYDNQPIVDDEWTSTLFRRALNSTTNQALAQVTSSFSGTSDSIRSDQTTAITNPVVLGASHSYFLRVSHSGLSDFALSDLRYYGCLILYELSEPSSD